MMQESGAKTQITCWHVSIEGVMWPCERDAFNKDEDEDEIMQKGKIGTWHKLRDSWPSHIRRLPQQLPEKEEQ